MVNPPPLLACLRYFSILNSRTYGVDEYVVNSDVGYEVIDVR